MPVRSFSQSSSGVAAMFSCTPDELRTITTLVGGDAATAAAVCATVDVKALGASSALIQWLVGQARQEDQEVQELAYGLNTNFLLSSAYGVFLMQAGFALYAAGVVRHKNVVMIFLKNFVDCCIAAITFYLVGYALAYGNSSSTNGFIGTGDFALSDTSRSNPAPYALFFWNWAFAAASTTILSGSIAERATFHSYLIYSFFMTTWVYPIVTHWLWSSTGWLSPFKANGVLNSGAIDFSGSGVVHLVGGAAALMGSIVTGPRIGRFDGTLPPSSFQGTTPSLYLLGTMILWFGWYGFNPGSHQAISTYKQASAVSRTAVVTTLAGASGALSALLLGFKRTRTCDLLQVCTGALAGLVSITAACGVVEPWVGIIAGIVSAPIYLYGEALLVKLQIDDPVGAFPVHGMCGAWGLMLVGLLAKEQYISEVYGKPVGKHLMGIFYGGHGQLLLCQFIAVLVIAAWSGFWLWLLFFTLNKLDILRVPMMAEAMGLDKAACGTQSEQVNPNTATKFSQSSLMSPAMTPSINMFKDGRAASLPRHSSNGFGYSPSFHAPNLLTITENSAGGPAGTAITLSAASDAISNALNNRVRNGSADTAFSNNNNVAKHCDSSTFPPVSPFQQSSQQSGFI